MNSQYQTTWSSITIKPQQHLDASKALDVLFHYTDVLSHHTRVLRHAPRVLPHDS
jgi:hypothetical protein